MALNPTPTNTATLQSRNIVRRIGGTESVIEVHQVTAAGLTTWKAANAVIGAANGVEPSCKLARITEPLEDSFEMVAVQLDFVNPLFEQGAGRYRDLPAGTVFLESSSNRNEIEVEEYIGGADFKQTTRAVVEATFTRTEVFTSVGWEWTQAIVIGNLNVRENPAGMTFATANAWLNIGRQISQEGDKIIVVETWAYNPQLWPAPL